MTASKSTEKTAAKTAKSTEKTAAKAAIRRSSTREATPAGEAPVAPVVAAGPAGRAKRAGEPAAELPVVFFSDPTAWWDWLAQNHAGSRGVWLKMAKKASGITSLTYAQALDGALCWGWIDGQVRGVDEATWVQRYTPRAARSLWSKVNREKVAGLIEAGKMQPAGLREIERAKADGRWEAAYDSPSRATVPPDLAAALAGNERAAAFFATLDSRNRYAILHRIQTVKKAGTRAAKIAQFVEMLARHEKLHT